MKNILSTSGLMKKYEEEATIDKLTGFFHRIAAFFTRLFR